MAPETLGYILMSCYVKVGEGALCAKPMDCDKYYMNITIEFISCT
jgi:hypothetical protein